MTQLVPYRLASQLFNRTIQEMRHDLNRRWEEPGSATTSFWSPPVNIRETSDELHLSVDLPGVQRADISLHVEGNTLYLKGERRWESEAQEGEFHRIEKAYGHFERTFLLPAGVQREQLKATLKDGVLTLRLPKSEDLKRKAIDIQIE